MTNDITDEDRKGLVQAMQSYIDAQDPKIRQKLEQTAWKVNMYAIKYKNDADGFTKALNKMMDEIKQKLAQKKVDSEDT